MRLIPLAVGLLLSLVLVPVASAAEGDSYTVDGPSAVRIGETYTVVLTVLSPDGTAVMGEAIRAERTAPDGSLSTYDLVTDEDGEVSVTAMAVEPGTETVVWSRVDGDTLTEVARSTVSAPACRCSPALPRASGRDVGRRHDVVVVHSLTPGMRVVLRRTQPGGVVLRERVADGDVERFRVHDPNGSRRSTYDVVVREDGAVVSEEGLRLR